MTDRQTENNLKNNYYVLVFDSIWENPISYKPNYLAVFLYVLSHAYKKDREFIFNNKKILVKRGQWLGSLRKIAEHFNLSISSVQKICKYLKSEHIIEHQTNTKFTLFTVLNYDSYQPKLNTKLNTKRTPSETKDNVYKDNKVNIISKDITKREFGNPQINEIISYFKETLNLPLLDYSEKKNRQYANLLIKKFGSVDKVKLLIQATKANQFWSTKITSLVDLYYKAVNIISSNRSQKGGVLKL